MSVFVSAERFKRRLDSIRVQNLAAIILLLFFLVISIMSIQGKSRTYDEADHLRYGLNILNGDSTRFDDSKMPVTLWNALPTKIAGYLPETRLKTNLEKLNTARLMTTLFSMAVGFMVFLWSRKLYGFIPALVSLGLYVFDPNIIAHSQLVTTDIYGMGVVLFCCYWLWRFANSRKWQDGLIFAVVLGLAQLAKYTAVSLYPVLAITFLISDLPRLQAVYKEKGRLDILREAWRYVKYMVVVAAISVLIINIGFLFNRSFTPLKDYQFKSVLLQSIQSRIDFLVPAPYPFLQGFDWIYSEERTNLRFIYNYLLGETRLGVGFKGYYIVATLLKIPIATQIIFWIALGTYFLDAKRRRRLLINEWFLLWPVLFYTIYFNFLYSAQMGLRHYLIVFPLLYVFTGNLFEGWERFASKQKRLAFVLAAYLIVSVVSYYPNYLAYFNEFLWDRKMAYKYLADSNVDFGQDYYALVEYKNTHPGVRKAPEVPSRLKRTTTYFLDVNILVGAFYGPEHYAWLRENFEPVGMIAPSYLLFTIKPEQMDHLCATTSYCK